MFCQVVQYRATRLLNRRCFQIVRMVPTLPATAAAAPAPAPAPAPAAPGSSGPPQRQSCDRCHKQKLRCTRSKNSEGGVCDRCLSKRTQCVYSFSLPKGRPSLHRPADGSSSGGGSSTESTRLSRPAPKSRTASLLSETLEPPAVCESVAPSDQRYSGKIFGLIGGCLTDR